MQTNYDIDTVAACDAGAEIELLHPATNEPTGMFVSIVGRDSAVFQALIAKAADAERRRQFAAQKRGKVAEPKLYADSVREGIEMLAAATLGFKNIVLDGEPLSFSEANAVRFYTKRPAFKTQVDEAIANLENFIKS